MIYTYHVYYYIYVDIIFNLIYIYILIYYIYLYIYIRNYENNVPSHHNIVLATHAFGHTMLLYICMHVRFKIFLPFC